MTVPLTDTDRDRIRAIGNRTITEVSKMADFTFELFCDLCGKQFSTTTITDTCPPCAAVAARTK